MSLNKAQLDAVIAELKADCEREIKESEAAIRERYQGVLALLREKVTACEPVAPTSVALPSSTRPSTMTVRRPRVQPRLAFSEPQGRGAISTSIREFVKSREPRSSFMITDVRRHLIQNNVNAAEGAISTVIKRLVKAGEIVRVRRGSATTRAIFSTPPAATDSRRAP